jgi:NitT/TauT family transport system ATP-binding protein
MIEARLEMLAFQNVRKEFRRSTDAAPSPAIDDVSFVLGKREFVSVVGPSGCGKTTLLRIASGMVEPTAGKLTFENSERRVATGFVFQNASLFPWRTVAQNIAYGLELERNRRRTKLSGKAAQDRVHELIEVVGLRGFADYYPAEISGGMRQRCNLARALAIQPELLLMDEPFSALDAQTREELQLELQRISTELGTTVLFVTHDIREAAFLSDRIVVLSRRPSTVLEIVTIAQPRPRDFDFQVSNEFNSVMRHLFGLVHQQGVPV